jgi:Rrf2 family protein
MQITRQADYAVRAVVHLAQLEPGARVSTGHIAREQKIPPSFLAKIVSQLSIAGVLSATRGARGGVMLARPADEISLLEIVEVIDGPMLLNECVLDPGTCPLGESCLVQRVWCEAQAALVARLSQTKFGQLVRRSS